MSFKTNIATLLGVVYFSYDVATQQATQRVAFLFGVYNGLDHILKPTFNRT